MLVQVNEYSVIDTKKIRIIEKSSISGTWLIYLVYDDSEAYTLDFVYCTIERLINIANGGIDV